MTSGKPRGRGRRRRPQPSGRVSSTQNTANTIRIIYTGIYTRWTISYKGATLVRKGDRNAKSAASEVTVEMKGRTRTHRTLILEITHTLHERKSDRTHGAGLRGKEGCRGPRSQVRRRRDAVRHKGPRGGVGRHSVAGRPTHTQDPTPSSGKAPQPADRVGQAGRSRPPSKTPCCTGIVSKQSHHSAGRRVCRVHVEESGT